MPLFFFVRTFVNVSDQSLQKSLVLHLFVRQSFLSVVVRNAVHPCFFLFPGTSRIAAFTLRTQCNVIDTVTCNYVAEKVLAIMRAHIYDAIFYVYLMEVKLGVTCNQDLTTLPSSNTFDGSGKEVLALSLFRIRCSIHTCTICTQHQ